MSGTGTTLSALKRNWNMVTTAVSDVDEETMAVRPNHDSNSMSWLVWHMSRVTDRCIHFRLSDKPQLWSINGWHAKFPDSANPDFEINPTTLLMAPHVTVARYQLGLIRLGTIPDTLHPFIPPVVLARLEDAVVT